MVTFNTKIKYEFPNDANEYLVIFDYKNLFLVASKVVWMIPIKNPDIGHISQSETY